MPSREGGGGGGKGVHYPGPAIPKNIFFFPIVCDDPFVFNRALNFSLTATVSLYWLFFFCTQRTATPPPPPLVESAENGQHPPPPPPRSLNRPKMDHHPPPPPRSLNRPKAVQGQGSPRERPSPGPHLALNGHGKMYFSLRSNPA